MPPPGSCLNLSFFIIEYLLIIIFFEGSYIMEYGLIGEKLGHSFSKPIHEMLADYQYNLIELNKDQLDDFLRDKNFKGINVTIPYKSAVIPHLDYLDKSAKEIGAVNTIVNKNNKLSGYNTDYYGFLYTLEHHDIDIEGQKIIVLGNGGAAKAVTTVLEDLNAGEIVIVGRTIRSNTISFEDCYKNHTDGKIIVNCTPLGMYPNVDESPLDLESFRSCNHVIDLIYNPIQTRLLKQAKDKGIYPINGLEMLIAQAKVAAEYFLDTNIDNHKIQEILEKMNDG